ncbi:MAG: outer membrane protein [Pyrinomonadaceae bacterium]|jgi:HAE1 family hydrophobic/amphiphilic exporter-1|nr:outer membrane protein [Pyrinomonadaceae bacterium]
MFSNRMRSTLQTATMWMATCAVVLAQTPAPSQPSPAQRDATRPPGAEQRQTTPDQSRPRPSDPTAPPATQRISPQTPPGTTDPARRPVNPTVAPAEPQSPSTVTPQTTPSPDASPLPSDATPSDPVFPLAERRPVPPMPSLVRLGVQSSNTIALTLNEAIRRALANNNEIEVARNDVRFAESILRGLEGVYDPVLQFRPEIDNSVRPVINIFGGADQSGTVSTTDYNSSMSATKQFAKGGGNYSYFFNNTREKTSASNTSLNPFYSASQGIQFTQPLFRNRSIDRNRQQIRVQRKRVEQSDADFRIRTIGVISTVQRVYWDLVFALRDEQNQIANLNLARENFRRTEASVAAGASAPLERAEVQTELSNREASLLIASQGVSISENNLKQLILRDPLAPEWSAALVPTDEPSFDETPVNLNDALTEARANRPELRRLKLQEEINNIDIQYFKNQTKPVVDLTGTFSTTGLAGSQQTTTGATTPVPLIGGDPNTSASAFLLRQLQRNNLILEPIPFVTPVSAAPPEFLIGGYGQTLQNLFGFKTRNIVAGVTIQLPLRNRTAEANLAGARIQKEQLVASMRSQEQGVEVEVRNAAQAVETARRRVLSARQARANAELQLTGEQRLFQVGRSTTFLLFQRENQLVNARNQELRAETDYNKALAELQRATSTTLRANNVIVEMPTLN